MWKVGREERKPPPRSGRRHAIKDGREDCAAGGGAGELDLLKSRQFTKFWTAGLDTFVRCSFFTCLLAVPGTYSATSARSKLCHHARVLLRRDEPLAPEHDGGRPRLPPSWDVGGAGPVGVVHRVSMRQTVGANPRQCNVLSALTLTSPLPFACYPPAHLRQGVRRPWCVPLHENERRLRAKRPNEI